MIVYNTEQIITRYFLTIKPKLDTEEYVQV